MPHRANSAMETIKVSTQFCLNQRKQYTNQRNNNPAVINGMVHLTNCPAYRLKVFQRNENFS